MGFILGFLFRSLIGLLFTILGVILALTINVIKFFTSRIYKNVKIVCDQQINKNAEYVKKRNTNFIKYANKKPTQNQVKEKNKTEEPPLARRVTRVC